MNKENFEEEIDIIKLVKHILSKWKLLIIVGLCFAVLGFGYKYYKTEFSKIPLAEIDKLFEIERINEKGVKEKIKVSYNLYVEDYNANLAQYNTLLQAIEDRKRNINSDIQKIQETIDNTETYYQESVLYNMDPANFSKLSKTIMIYNKDIDSIGGETPTNASIEGEEIANTQIEKNANNPTTSEHTVVENSENGQKINIETSTDSIYVNYLAAYMQAYMQSSDLSDKVRVLLNKKKEKIDSYIRELYGFNVQGNSINFFVQTDSEQLSKSILSLIEKELKAKLSEILIPGLSYRILDADNYNGYSNWIYNKKIDDKNNYINLQNAVSEKKRQLARVVSPLKPDVLINNPEGPLNLDKYKQKKYLMFSIAGFVFGLFALSGLYTLLYLFPGRIRDNSLFARNLNIRTLATFSSDNDETSKKILNEQLDVHTKGMKNIVLVSTLGNAEISTKAEVLVNLLKTKGISSMVIDKDQVANIANSDAVIFVERIDFSKTNEVLKEIDIVQDLKKEILGFVYL